MVSIGLADPCTDLGVFLDFWFWGILIQFPKIDFEGYACKIEKCKSFPLIPLSHSNIGNLYWDSLLIGSYTLLGLKSNRLKPNLKVRRDR